MNGPLAKGIVPSLLREIYVGRRSGWLRLMRGEERQSVRFRRGHIVNAHTNVVVERLGEMLVRHGKLSPEGLARATEIVVREKARLGEVLMRLGLIDPSGLEDALALHVHEMLTKVFAWDSGSYSFEPEAADNPLGELTLKLSTGELILETVRATGDPSVVRESLGDLDRVLELSQDPLLRFQKISLSPVDGFLLSRIDGTLSAAQVIAMMPLSAEDAERSLLGLLSTGVVQYAPPQRRSPAETGARGRTQPTPPAAVTTEPQPAPQPPPPPPHTVPVARVSPADVARATSPVPAPATASRPPAATSGPASADPVAERRREIAEVWQGMQTRNHFEILGIPRSASEVEVKEAYFRLARRFHPDTHHGEALDDLRDTLEAVFIRLGEVYEVLRDPRRRAEYAERLSRATPAAGQVPVGSAAAANAPPARDEEAEAQVAEEAVKNAGRLYEKEQYWDAIQALEPIVTTMRPPARVRARVILARCYLKNPKWARRAEEALIEVTREDPRVVDAWVLLGSIYEEKGIPTRAASMYRRALELKPDHEDAARFVAAHPPAEEPQLSEEQSGLLRRLFKKP